VCFCVRWRLWLAVALAASQLAAATAYSWLRVRGGGRYDTIRYAPILLAFSAAHTLLPVLLLLLLGERSDLLGLS
jgi:hypothetical protein